MSTHWTNPPAEPSGEGFCYKITNLKDGRIYIGKKTFWRRSKRKICGESNWRTYSGSCKALTADLKELGQENFRFEILSFHDSKSELNYWEVKHQVLYEVLEKDSYNGQLGNTKIFLRKSK